MKKETTVSIDSTGQIIDPFAASINALLVVLFPKTNSPNYTFAVKIAESAERYGFASIDGKIMHFTAFGKTQADAGRASALLSYAKGWKGVLIFVKGKKIRDSYHLSEVLDCYLESTMCRDVRAHCQSIVDSSFQGDFGRAERFIFPCKFLQPWFQPNRDHPSSLEDQIEAAGVKLGCNVCPNFFPENLKRIENGGRKYR